MSCFRPLDAWRRLDRVTERGKAAIVFKRPPGPAEAIRVPCGACRGCQIDRSREWALRCIHEASLHDENCFVTLTYDDAHLPEGGSLVRRDGDKRGHHQQFMHDLRREFALDDYGFPKRIRFFMCGEYGEVDMRPHWHFLLFNHNFDDRYYWCKSHSGEDIFRSDALERIWTYGNSTIQEVTWSSAAYVARYTLKKAYGQAAQERYLKDVNPETGECTYLEPEYCAMSRRPGIGAEWYAKYRDDLRKGFLTAELGKKFCVPDYYLSLLEREDHAEYARLKAVRKEAANAEVLPRKRLKALEHHKVCQTKRLKRSI